MLSNGHGGFGEKSGETEQGQPCHRAPGLLCEYGQVRRLGLASDDLHALVEQARQRALGLLQDRSGPFADPWTAWSPDPAWPLPALPDSADGTAPR
ncbi:hypothetical protein [Streptomyces sp. CB01881]|uniref:hypothetical protein n=1 Tax=Streptomyces sp. CB01881 TaxID=2078691 RepID=UPI0011E0131F|nr:hypothetical protein [Streptomyces sp. CB01881]TYC68628.1 hypothetical protein EH183_37695 [Streptomyces sp. CB01881]